MCDRPELVEGRPSRPSLAHLTCHPEPVEGSLEPSQSCALSMCHPELCVTLSLSKGGTRGRFKYASLRGRTV